MSQIKKVAFLHGWGLNRQIWTEVQEQLTQSMPSIECQLLDLPGYGGAPDIEKADDLNNVAAYCLQQLNEPVLLVGWSLGGMTAMKMALMDAQSEQSYIQGMQLITTAAKFVSSENWSYGVDLGVFQRFSDELANDYQRTLTMFLLLQAGSSAGSRELARAAHQAICSLPDPSPKTLQDGIDSLAKADLRDDLAQLDLPVQVISGVRDRVANPSSSAKLAESLSAQLVEIDSGHSPFMTKPDEYLQCLVQLINKVNNATG